MNSETVKTFAAEATAVIAGIPALVPYAAPISLGIAIAAAVAPEIYDEIKILFSRAASGATIPDEEIARLHELIAALKSPEKYFDTPPAAPAPEPPPAAPETNLPAAAESVTA